MISIYNHWPRIMMMMMMIRRFFLLYTLNENGHDGHWISEEYPPNQFLRYRNDNDDLMINYINNNLIPASIQYLILRNNENKPRIYKKIK